MDLLKVKLGDELNIADAKFKVTAKLSRILIRSWVFLAFRRL